MSIFIKLVTQCVFISFLFSLSTAPALADDQCSIWPYQFPTKSDGFINIYSGECKGGFADGKGIVRSYYTFTPDYDESTPDKNKPTYTFEGYFRQGAFVGEQYYSGKILFGRQDLITMIDKGKGKEVWLHTSVERSEPVNLCLSRRINVGVNQYEKYKTDIKLSEAILAKAYKTFQSLCPSFDQWMDIILYEMKDTKTFAGNAGDIQTRFDARGNGKAEHSNVFYARAEYKKQAEQANKKRQDEIDKLRRNIVDFFEKGQVSEFVLVDQLIKNPFRWDNKTVAVAVELDEMISATEALVIAPDGYYGRILLSGITPDMFKDKALLMVVSVDGKVKYGGVSLTGVSYVAHRDCLGDTCQEIGEVQLTNYLSE